MVVVAEAASTGASGATRGLFVLQLLNQSRQFFQLFLRL